MEQSLEVNQGTSKDGEETSDCVEIECSSDNKQEEIKSGSSSLANATNERQTVTAASKKEVKSIYFNSKETEKEGLPQQREPLKSHVKGNGLVRHLSEPGSKENLPGKNFLKRTNSEVSLRAVKRQKQSSILSSFGKKTEKDSQDGVTKELLCPVCGVKFASGTKNADINKHIDGCLIE